MIQIYLTHTHTHTHIDKHTHTQIIFFFWYSMCLLWKFCSKKNTFFSEHTSSKYRVWSNTEWGLNLDYCIPKKLFYMQNSIMILGNTRNRYCLFYAKIWPFARVFDTKGMFDSKRISVKFYIYMHNEESSCTMANVCVCNIFNILKYIFYIFLYTTTSSKKRGRTTSATIGVCVLSNSVYEKKTALA